MSPADGPRAAIGRRAFLTAAALGVGALVTACGDDGASTGAATTTSGAAPATPPVTTPPSTTPPSTTPATAQFVVSRPKDHDRVAITLHTAGDVGLVNQLLDVFTSREVHVTAFIVGQWLEANPDMAARIAGGGHEFANHTYSHSTFADLSPDAMREEIVRCRDVIDRLIGSPREVFPPSGTPARRASPRAQGVHNPARPGSSSGLRAPTTASRRPGSRCSTSRPSRGIPPCSASTWIRTTTPTPAPTRSCNARSTPSQPVRS